ncbi:fluoride efflux transporter CrcB [Rhizobium sp. Root1220]|uniref:fluoride efflux transporter CrcB n=1 Tax=Rhizobium sp. Root1220 TaxID=1736432 RepID=UPI0006FFC44C|nr:fluoride efflux transporter CrcB [Rhizobium sp. Root1220]KQV78124.1 hypothetical protein ASC90_27085 [Rhizobium sp. Root1220]
MTYLLVFLGAGIGGVLRQAVNVLAEARLGAGFPAGTLTVNVTGSIIMGVIAGIFALRTDLPQDLKLFLTTGILGGFTTFSTFSLDSINLWDRGQEGLALVYVIASLLLSLSGLALGMIIVRLFQNVSM